MSVVRTHIHSIRTIAVVAFMLALTSLMLYTFTTSVVRAVAEVVRPVGYSLYSR
jgi:hypothetical protein